MAELRVEPVPSQPGYEYLRHIHTRMFERIVPGIAGQLRDVNVQASQRVRELRSRGRGIGGR